MYPVDVSAVIDVMGGPGLMAMTGTDLIDLQRAIAHGLPVAVARNVATSVAPSDSAARQRVSNLIASPATLKRGKPLSPGASEKAERLARVTAYAHDVLGRDGRAQQWLTQFHMLFGAAPIDVASTELGARRVERILTNI